MSSDSAEPFSNGAPELDFTMAQVAGHVTLSVMACPRHQTRRQALRPGLVAWGYGTSTWADTSWGLIVDRATVPISGGRRPRNRFARSWSSLRSSGTRTDVRVQTFVGLDLSSWAAAVGSFSRTWTVLSIAKSFSFEDAGNDVVDSTVPGFGQFGVEDVEVVLALAAGGEFVECLR